MLMPTAPSDLQIFKCHLVIKHRTKKSIGGGEGSGGWAQTLQSWTNNSYRKNGGSFWDVWLGCCDRFLCCFSVLFCGNRRGSALPSAVWNAYIFFQEIGCGQHLLTSNWEHTVNDPAFQSHRLTGKMDTSLHLTLKDWSVDLKESLFNYGGD